MAADSSLNVLHAHHVATRGSSFGQFAQGELLIDWAPGEGRLCGETNQRAFELAHVALNVLSEEHGNLVIELDPLQIGLFLDDRDSGLQLGHLDVGDQTRGEARNQTFRHLLQLLRILVTGHDDGFVRIVQSVEGVEELFLRLLAPSQKLNVIEQQ